MVIAIVIGAAVGAERQRGDHAAGMRTHAAVCLGSAVFMLVSAYSFPDLYKTTGLRIDPTRIAAQVVSGIGFIGAGMIFTQQNVVRGLTTAAGLWVVAGLGLAVGAGLYGLAVAGAVLMLVVLALLRPLERKLFPAPIRLFLRVHPEPGQIEAIRSALQSSGTPVRSISIEMQEADEERIDVQCGGMPPARLDQLLTAVRSLPGVLSVEALAVDVEVRTSRR